MLHGSTFFFTTDIFYKFYFVTIVNVNVTLTACAQVGFDCIVEFRFCGTWEEAIAVLLRSSLEKHSADACDCMIEHSANS